MPSFRHTAALTFAAPFALALSLSLATSVRAQCPDQYVTSTTDRFSGVITTKTNFGLAMYKTVPNLRCFASANGKLREFSVAFTRIDERFHYLQCHSVYILADGKPVKPLKDEVTPLDAGSEIVSVTLSASAVAQIGAAEKIEFKVCNDELLATPAFVAAAQEFACKMVGLKPSRVRAAPSATAPAQSPPSFHRQPIPGAEATATSPDEPPGAPTVASADSGSTAAVPVEPATVAPAQSLGFRRVAVAGTSLSYPYTVEIPSDWYIYQEGNPHSMLLLVPPGARNGDPNIIGVVACKASLTNPDEVVANVKRTLKGVKTALVKDVDGVRGVLAEWDQGNSTVLGLMLPTSTGCVQFMGQSPSGQFASRRARYERIILSVHRAQ